MIAIVLERARSLMLYQLAEPAPDDGHLLVSVASVCLSDGDLDAFHHGDGALPRVFGTRGVGRVVEREQAGRIMSMFGSRRGIPAGTLVAFDLDGLEVGALQETVSVPVGRCHRLPDEIPVDRLALVPDLAEMCGVIRSLEPSPHDVVVVYGARASGLLLALVAQAVGLRTILVDPSRARLTRARELGIETTINPISASIPEELDFLTGGRVDTIIDTSGNAEIMPTVRAIARPGTTIVLGEAMDFDISLAEIVADGLTVRAMHPVAADYDLASDLAQQLPLDALVSVHVPARDVPSALPAVVREIGTVLRMVAYFGTERSGATSSLLALPE